jgi:putative ABC transport system permease protein
MWRVRGIPRAFRFPWRTNQQISDEVDAELRFHLEMRTEALERDGLTPDGARREARREFGDVAVARRQLTAYGRRSERQTRLRSLVEDFFRDTRYAWRGLRRSPGFACVAIAVLALGIGVNSAAFNLVNLLLVSPVLMDEPERVVSLYSQNLARPNLWRSFSYGEFSDLRAQNRAFEELAAFTMNVVGVGEGDATRRSLVGIVSANYFRAFGVPLALGRDFTAEEEQPATVPVAIVSHSFWMRRGGRADVLGSILRVNGEVVEVVGVAAPGFTGISGILAPEVWLPLGMLERIGTLAQGDPRPSLSNPQSRILMPFGRFAPDATRADVDADLGALAARLGPSYRSPEGELYHYVSAAPPRISIATAPESGGPLVGVAVLLVAMSGVVLVIACLNLANMFLARGAMRRTELAIRQSLGGGRSRLVRQLLTEGLLLTIGGGAVGFVLAYWGTQSLMASLASVVTLGTPLNLAVQPDPWVFVATAAASIVATLLFGLGPSLKATDGSLTASLKDSVGIFGARRRGRMGFLRTPRSVLIVAQISLSLMLLTAGGLFVRGALATRDANPGFALESGGVVELDTSLVGYDEARSRDAYARVLERVRSMPGVENAALASLVPFGDLTRNIGVHLPGAATDDVAVANYYVIGDGYFESLGLPLLRGRDFTPVEGAFAGGAPVAIIDEPLAQQLFGVTDVVGRQLQVRRGPAPMAASTFEIVGIAPGTRHQLYDRGPASHIYLPFGQRFEANMHVHVRAAEPGRGLDGLLARVREEIRAVDPILSVLSVKTLTQHRDGSLFVRVVRVGGEVFAILGALALLLAVIGVYGVMGFMMARRTREIGVRIALGATSGGVVRQMVRGNLTLTALGLGIGLLLALGVARLLRSLLFEVSALDPLVFLGATAVLASAATLAAYLPARRASRIQPTAALRHE